MKQNTCSLLFAICLLFFASCYSETAIIKPVQNQKVSGVILNDGKELDFSDDELGYALVKDDAVVRFLNNGSIEEIALSKIKVAYYREELFSRTSDSTIPLMIGGFLLSVALLVFYFI